MGQNNESEELKIKIILAGDKGVGKTNIKNRFFKGTFNQYSNSTSGIQMSKRKFWAPFKGREEAISLCCWDISGDLDKNSLLLEYCKNAIGIIYVYDTTQEQSLQNLNKWKQIVSEHSNSQIFTEMLIGNKCDLVRFRQVRYEQGKKWALRNKIQLFFQTSALLNFKIEEAVEELLRIITSKFDENITKPIKLKITDKRHRGCC